MKWFLLLLTTFTFSICLAAWEDLPLPLPDDPPGTSQPDPTPQPAPTPEPPQPPSGPSYSYSVGAGDTGRFKERAFTFYPRLDWNRITYVRILGVNNNIKIKSVLIRYADNLNPDLAVNLTGELKTGGILQTWLQGRPIYSITVFAQNKYFWKKPGSFRIDVTGYH
ncbi:MAG: hypothetical protein ACM3MG_06805 [Bacillota bacterium]